MTSGISSLTSTASSTSGTSSGTNAQAIAGNFQQFLTLLTTQLQNQNPLDPMDTNQFTQQLVQFAGVEQQLKTNDRLDSILTSSKNASAATATSYIGKSVTSDGTTADLTAGGTANWNLNASRAATKAVVSILDSSGNVVATQNTTLTTGSQTYTWNGRATSGMSAPAGTYTIKVTAQDATGSAVSVDTTTSGVVDEVDLSSGSPILLIGKQRVPLSSVQTIGLSTTTG